jgi:hypothetical protein
MPGTKGEQRRVPGEFQINRRRNRKFNDVAPGSSNREITKNENGTKTARILMAVPFASHSEPNQVFGHYEKKSQHVK